MLVKHLSADPELTLIGKMDVDVLLEQSSTHRALSRRGAQRLRKAAPRDRIATVDAAQPPEREPGR